VLGCRKACFIWTSNKCKTRVPHILISSNLPEQHIGQGNGKAIHVQTQRFPEVWRFQVSRRLAHEGVKFVSFMHRPPLTHASPQEIFLILTPVRCYVPEELCQWKIPVTPSGIETANFRLIAQYVYVGKQLIKIYLWPENFVSFGLYYSLILRVCCKEKYIEYRNVYRRNTSAAVDAHTVCWRRPDWGCSNCCRIRRKSCTCYWCTVLTVGYRQRTRDLWKERITLLCENIFIVVIAIVKVFWVTWNWLTKV
jgi:hypothetical protein